MFQGILLWINFHAVDWTEVAWLNLSHVLQGSVVMQMKMLLSWADEEVRCILKS